MEIICSKKNRTLIVKISGEIDHHTSAEIKDKIDNHITRNSVKNIVFDFKDVSFMDSSGIGMLLGRYRNIENYGGCLCVTGITPEIERIFTISGLFKLFKRYDNVNDAFIKEGF